MKEGHTLNCLLLLLIVLGCAYINTTKKVYNEKVSDQAPYFYCATVSISAMFFFVITAGGFRINLGYLPYSVGFALSYGIASVASVYAILYGSFTLTNLFISFSTLIPSLTGIIFFKEPVSFWMIGGIVLLIISLILINMRDETIERISFKWLVYVTLSFLGNGMCNIFQKLINISDYSEFKNEFMIVALGIVGIVFLIVAFYNEKSLIKTCISKGLPITISSGIVNGAVNLFVLILSGGRIPLSLMYPIMSAGGIITTYIISKIIFKEKLSKKQFYGFIAGTASIILLNL